MFNSWVIAIGIVPFDYYCHVDGEEDDDGESTFIAGYCGFIGGEAVFIGTDYQKKSYGQRFNRKGHTLKMTLNLKKGAGSGGPSLSYVINGKDYGKATDVDMADCADCMQCTNVIHREQTGKCNGEKKSNKLI